jgi:hypothetical protein
VLLDLLDLLNSSFISGLKLQSHYELLFYFDHLFAAHEIEA